MPQMPGDRILDHSLALLRDPYRYISKRCRRYGSDLFETRLLLQRTICMTGSEAAELFYDPQRFMRQGAAPKPILKTLFGQGGVQGLDGEAHRHRKAMFLSLMTPDRLEELSETTAGRLHESAMRWTGREQVVLYDELREVLTRSVCVWAGVPLAESEVGRRTAQLTALFDDAATAGPRHWRARRERKQANRWGAEIIEQIRAGRRTPPESSAAHVIARHRDVSGEQLGPHVAAVELLNVLRPTVAVSVFVVFVAHALHQHSEHRRQIQTGDEGDAERFVQEVRRFYPFFPAVAARVRHDFQWKGYRFPQGRRVLLDLYGTNHDPRMWDAPDEFRPERFRSGNEGPFNFIPQGGGDHSVNHRCPGEWIAIELMKVALRFLTTRLTYDVPEQDLRIDFSRLPALPRSRFIISNASPSQ